jgi:TRAP transporter TAXI family solute receptor
VRILALTTTVVVVGFAVAYRWVQPAPPRTVVLAAGEEGGAYALFASRYREFLSRYDITLDVRYSAGSVENLALLREGEADLALVQGGIADPEASSGLLSLGGMFYEPLWVFVRAGVEAETLSDLAGRRLGVGAEGSGTRALVARLLEANGVTRDSAQWVPAVREEAMAALRAGELDALFLVASPRSPAVRSLLGTRGVRLAGMDRAEAYTRLWRSLSRVVLPEGSVDLAGNTPMADTVLVSSVAGLVARDDFHPALVDLFLQGAKEIHGTGGLLEEPGEFPSPRHAELPLSPEADRFYRYGPSLLQRYLPFWAATQIDRLKVMLIPLIALLIPLARVLPPTYRWRVRSRVYRWYGQLRELDPGSGALDAAERERRLIDIDRIEQEVTGVSTPLSYAAELYHLRLHISLVRQKLQSATPPLQIP